MSKMWTDRTAIFVVRAGDDFVPLSPWDIPQSFTEARRHSQHVPLEDARAVVRCLNKTAITTRNADPAAWDRQWTIAVACARSKGLDRLICVRSANLAPRRAKDEVTT
jgi:hypothetical protein